MNFTNILFKLGLLGIYSNKIKKKIFLTFAYGNELDLGL